MGRVWKKREDRRCLFFSSSMLSNLLLCIFVLLLNPPKYVFRDIERLFAKFLWGSYEGYAKRHRCLRRTFLVLLSIIALLLIPLHHPFAFVGKLWWQFCTKNNLWSHFMCFKYGDQIHIYSHLGIFRVFDSYT